jgi:2-aminoethylphosphonate-pyruvate transaminase
MLLDIGHREPEFSALLAETRRRLLEIAGVGHGYSCVVLSGSGTTAIESALASLAGVSTGVLILANGVYGERAAQIANTFGLPFTLQRFPWCAPLSSEQMEPLIRNTHHDFVYLVHHETTTGILNPLQEIAAIAKRSRKRLFVDAVSSVAGEALDIAGWDVDLVIGSANKCIRGVPGISFVVLSKELGEILSRRRRIVFTNDLIATYEAEEAGETPFTPPVHVFYALREALRELMDEGVAKRIAGYQNIARILRDGLSALELSFLVSRIHMSNTMTSVVLPEGISYEYLHGRLKESGYVIYKSQGPLAHTSFRLGSVGVVTEEDIRGFLSALERTLAGQHALTAPAV